MKDRRPSLALGLVLLLAFAFFWVRQGARESSSASRAGLAETGLAETGSVEIESPTSFRVEPQRSGGDLAAARREPTAPLPGPMPSESSEAHGADARVSVRFLEAGGNPLAGVSLTPALPMEVGLVATGISGPDGFAELILAPSDRPRPLELVARGAGFALERRRATLEPGQDLRLGDWALVPGGSVGGIVCTTDGLGLAGIEVACLAPGRRLEGELPRGPMELLCRPGARTRSSSDGSFLLEGVPAGQGRLVAVHPDRPTAVSEPVDVPAHGRLDGVRIAMDAPDSGTSLAGVVLGPEGEPVPQAELVLAGKGSSYTMRADGEGRFRIRFPDRAARDVTALDPERRLREARARGVLMGTQDLVLRLTEAPEVELRVHDREGVAIERFAVVVTSAEGAMALGFFPPDARPDGRLAFGAPASVFRIEVRANGWRLARLGPFAPDSPPPRIAVTLEPAGGVFGTVLVDGVPAAGVRLALHATLNTHVTYNGFPLRTEREPVVVSASDDEGRFALSVEEAGDYWIRAEAKGLALAELGPLSLTPERRLEQRVELGHGGGLEVQVHSLQGASLVGVLVAISRGDGNAFTRRTGSEGTVTFERLTPGPWQVQLVQKEIQAAFGVTQLGDDPARAIPANCRVFEDETARVDLWLEEDDDQACVLLGRLQIDGRPAEGWLAVLESAGQAKGPPQPFHEPGAFRCTAEAAGSYRLRLTRTGSRPEEMWALLDAVEVVEGTRHWSLEIGTGTLEGSLPKVEGLDFYRWRRGSVECFIPLVPESDGALRPVRVPAGHAVILSADPDRSMEEQTPTVLAEIEVEPGRTTTVP